MLRRVLRAVRTLCVLGGLFLLAAECMARLDDWLQYDVPLDANPDRERDLTTVDDHGIHGRPHGRYRKWQLNSFGFRGPEIGEQPAPGTTRVLILGASETFGLYESPGKEYPRQLADRLHESGHGRFEIVNGAMAGITLPTMKGYWDSWASRFGARVVLIYPSPIFYLDEKPPRVGGPVAPPPEPIFASRFYDRIIETLRRTAWVRKVRLEYTLAAQARGRPEGWLFREVPQERLGVFRADLAALVAAVRADGAEPILVTHAIRTTSPPRPEDMNDLCEMRRYAPHATEETIAAFDVAAAGVVRELGKAEGVPVIDAAAALSGQRQWFADLSHFTDEGAAKMAEVLAEGLIQIRSAERGTAGE